MYLRVNTLNKLVPYAAQRFIDNLPAIFAGTFNHALLEDASECSDLLKLYKNVAVKHVFSHPDVEQLELQGYRVIIETRLFHKLSTRHRLAYVEAVSKLPSDSPEFPLWEYYYRCRLLQDYISGMTDLYAWDEYRRLMAVEQ